MIQATPKHDAFPPQRYKSLFQRGTKAYGDQSRLDSLCDTFGDPCAWNFFKDPQVPPYILYGNGESQNVYSDEKILRAVDTFEITLCHSDYEERKKLRII